MYLSISKSCVYSCTVMNKEKVHRSKTMLPKTKLLKADQDKQQDSLFHLPLRYLLPYLFIYLFVACVLTRGKGKSSLIHDTVPFSPFLCLF